MIPAIATPRRRAGSGQGLPRAGAHDRDAGTGARQRRHRRRADRTARARPHAGARGDPAAGLGRSDRGPAARRARDRAAACRATGCASSRRAAASRSCLPARPPATSRARRPRVSTTRRSPCRRRCVAGDVVAFLEADKALDEAMAWRPTIRSRRASPRRCRPTAAASGSATRPTPAWPRRPSIHVGLIRAILDGDEEAAAAEAERLMALLRSHAEAAARR